MQQCLKKSSQVGRLFCCVPRMGPPNYYNVEFRRSFVKHGWYDRTCIWRKELAQAGLALMSREFTR